jgi:hypothetical protein
MEYEKAYRPYAKIKHMPHKRRERDRERVLARGRGRDKWAKS